jgi:hypothetical protein
MPKKLNAYFEKMLEAKRKGLESFEYNGNKYVKQTGKNGIVVYKKK